MSENIPTTNSRPKKASASRVPRRYGFACSNCNRRKIRCDGERPACRRCLKRGERCTYKPTEADANHLHQALERVSFLENQIRKLAVSDDVDRPGILEACGVAEEFDQEDSPESSHNAGTPQEPSNELSVDEHGQVQYFGSTSRFYLPDEQDEQPEHSQMRQPHGYNEQQHRNWLQSNFVLQQSLERLAFANLKNDTEVSPDVASALLQRYWTWQHPLHNYVYRRCFIRDLALGGPFFSQFLLNVIYAHAARHVQPNDPLYPEIGNGDKFLAKARKLLQYEMEQPQPKIPTIQGLLILGGRQCALGHNSEGWLYTGMAIRMMKDIGLHLAPHANFAPDDLEARRRLFISAFVWDKTISVCLGRPPSLTDMPFKFNPIWDNADDNDEWRPFGLDDTLMRYPPTRSMNATTFDHFRKLSCIINQTYEVVYSGTINPISIVKKVRALEDRLRLFRQDLPDSIKIENPSVMEHCPPPHIFSLNLLSHTLLILLYRPFLIPAHDKFRQKELADRARTLCLETSTLVHQYNKLHRRSFSFRNQTYLISYCVYTSATIDVHALKTSEESESVAAAERLSFALQMLDSEVAQTPGIKRSVDIIKTHLKTRFSPNASPKPIITLSGTRTTSKQSVVAPTLDTNIDPALQQHLDDALSQNALPLSGADLGMHALSDFQAPVSPLNYYNGTNGESAFNTNPNNQPWEDPFSSPMLADLTYGSVGGGFGGESLNWNTQDANWEFGYM